MRNGFVTEDGPGGGSSSFEPEPLSSTSIAVVEKIQWRKWTKLN